MNLGELVRDVMTALGYPGIALLVALENLFPPIPSEIVLPLAGFFVERGEFAYLWAVAAATVGSTLGALVLYWLARAGGLRAVLRYRALLRIDEDDLARLQRGFRRHGALYVAGARLIPALRSAVSVPAGLSEMPLATFTALTALGSGVWNAILIGAGWFLGSQYETVGDVLGPVSLVVVALLVLGGGAWFWRRRRSR